MYLLCAFVQWAIAIAEGGKQSLEEFQKAGLQVNIHTAKECAVNDTWATTDEDFDVTHLKVTSTQHALGWFEGGANIRRVLKYGENIRDRDVMDGRGR